MIPLRSGSSGRGLGDGKLDRSGRWRFSGCRIDITSVGSKCKGNDRVQGGAGVGEQAETEVVVWR